MHGVKSCKQKALRFEEWLSVTHGEDVQHLKDVVELIDRTEEWLRSIDVAGGTAARFARSLLSNLLGKNIIPERSKGKEVQIISGYLVDRRGQKWLDAEDIHLARMYANPKISVGFVARELGRSKKSIWSRARKYGLKRPAGAMTEAKAKRLKLSTK